MGGIENRGWRGQCERWSLAGWLLVLASASPCRDARAEPAPTSSAEAAGELAPARSAEPRSPPAPDHPPAPGDGWQRPPRRRLLLTSLLGFRYNALGLEEVLRLGGQFQLYSSERPLLRDNFIHLGVITRLSPSYARIGPLVEVQPMSIVALRLSGEVLGYFKTFGYLQSFQSPTAVWSDSALRAGHDQQQDYSTWGLHTLLEQLLMLRFAVGRAGHLVVRNKLAVEYWHMNLRGGVARCPPAATPCGRADTVFYEGSLDLMVPGDGWLLQDELDVLLQTPFRLTVGARYSAALPLYRDSDFVSAEEAHAYHNDNAWQRLGPVLAYTFFDRTYSRFARPTVIVLAGWYLQHRFRTGADTAAALPFMAIGFSFQGDLLAGSP